MSWSDPCAKCGEHRADCACDNWHTTYIHLKTSPMNNELKQWAAEELKLTDSMSGDRIESYRLAIKNVINKITELQSRPLGDVEGYLEGKVHDIDMPGWDSAVSYNDAIAALQALKDDCDKSQEAFRKEQASTILRQHAELRSYEGKVKRLTAEVERLKGVVEDCKKFIPWMFDDEEDINPPKQ